MKFYSVIVLVFFISVFTSCKAPNVPQSILTADVLGKEGKWDEAWDLIDDCVDQAETFPQVYFYAAMAQQRKTEPNLELAADFISKALLAQPEKSEIRFLAAHIYYENKDFALAIETLNPLIDANEALYYKLYKVYKAKKIRGESYKAEKAAIEKIVAEDEDHLALYVRCEFEKYEGNLEAFSKQNKAVDKLYERQLFTKRTSKEVHSFKALQYLYRNRDRIKMQRQLSLAYYRDRSNPQTALNIAVFWDKIAKRRSRAIPAYEKYLKVVKKLPVEETEAVKVQARLRALKTS